MSHDPKFERFQAQPSDYGYWVIVDTTTGMSVATEPNQSAAEELAVQANLTGGVQ